MSRDDRQATLIRNWIIISGVGLLSAGILIDRGRPSAEPIDRPTAPRPSLHAVPAGDVAALNTAPPRRVPKSLEPMLLPDDRPAVVLFLRASCGCSADFARWFTAIEPYLRPAASCIAVIEGDDKEAASFLDVTAMKVPHLVDPDGGLAAVWGVTKAGCIALVRPDCTVEVIWPGISRQGFRDLAVRLGDAQLLPDDSLIVLPGAATAGCPLASTPSPSTPGVSR